MANPHKGEVAFDGFGQTYTLRWTYNAICELETQTGMGVAAVGRELASWAPPTDDKGRPLPETPEQEVARIARLRATMVRAVFWAMLRDRHPDIDIRRAGELIGEIGGLNRAFELIGAAFERAAPETKGEGPTPAPPKGNR